MPDPTTQLEPRPAVAPSRPGRWPQWATIAVFAATLAQLVVAAFADGLPQFEGKGFGARLVTYPIMMLAVPVLWVLLSRRRRDPAGTGGPAGGPAAAPSAEPLPWAAFALVMSPFLIDVTGNTLNLYDTIGWWDDANHFANWLLLSAGLGLLLARLEVRPRWALGLLIAGVGALLAIGWEVGEWYAFIRHGTELDTAYEDTLLDQVLGSLGAAVAGLLIAVRPTPGGRRRPLPRPGRRSS